MTNADVRNTLAAAISTVDGLKGFAARPNSVNVGDGWPQWRGAVRGDDRIAFVNTWMVVIALAADEITADGQIDQHGEPLFEALSPLLYITAVEPAVLPMTGGDTYALQITGITE